MCQWAIRSRFDHAAKRQMGKVASLSAQALSVSPTKRLMQLGQRDIKKIDHVAYEIYPCGRCINTRHPLAFEHIVALRAQDEVTGRSEWTKRKGSNRTRLESYREVEPEGIQ